MKKLFIIGIVIIGMLIYFMYRTDPVHQIKTGEKILVCNGSKIDPNKVIAFDDEKGCFAFTNGWACNCYLEDKKN